MHSLNNPVGKVGYLWVPVEASYLPSSEVAHIHRFAPAVSDQILSISVHSAVLAGVRGVHEWIDLTGWRFNRDEQSKNRAAPIWGDMISEAAQRAPVANTITSLNPRRKRNGTISGQVSISRPKPPLSR